MLHPSLMAFFECVSYKLFQIIMTCAKWNNAGAERVQMGPFRGIRMKKTAPSGFKDEKRPRQVDRDGWR